MGLRIPVERLMVNVALNIERMNECYTRSTQNNLENNEFARYSHSSNEVTIKLYSVCSLHMKVKPICASFSFALHFYQNPKYEDDISAHDVNHDIIRQAVNGQTKNHCSNVICFYIYMEYIIPVIISENCMQQTSNNNQHHLLFDEGPHCGIHISLELSETTTALVQIRGCVFPFGIHLHSCPATTLRRGW